MRALIVLPLLAFGLTACATLPGTERTPFLPAGVYGVYQDNDTGAINHAAWAFASPANTRNNPVDAAKAVVALEYLSGELRENPRWIGIDSSVDVHIGRARDQLREILGIRPDAPPQVVVNTLLALSWDLQIGNQPGAMQVLASPLFTRPPAQTLQVLANLPYVQEANVATAQAADESSADGGWRG
ncbi:hypothetical protein [Acidisphaera sp. S103]|uniref:hypothetical protein n=1 Tax=Acidisphaera sp. S103 TaxID=1747223 RepID=UPI00131AB357|nr:hypothetical protein [Acidisphaera sp. S103]